MGTRLDKALAAAEYPCHVVCKGDTVRAEAVGWGNTSDGTLAPVHRRPVNSGVGGPLGNGRSTVSQSLV
jgi:hypothetical protein